MNWFWFAIIALLCWSGSDLFSKIGCCEEKDKTAHLKMVLAVGVVMGLHAIVSIFGMDVYLSWDIVWRYLPVSLLYILSMAIGYIGLRYIELSISSPICNASGAVVAIICLFTGQIAADYSGSEQAFIFAAIAVICCGVVGLGIVEAREDTELRAKRQEKANRRYAKSWLAICLPIGYCLLDAVGTFADSGILDTFHHEFVLSNFPAEFASYMGEFAAGMPESLEHLPQGLQDFVTQMEYASGDSANAAYELTFFAAGMVSLAILWWRKDSFSLRRERPKYIGALFETVGQIAYVYAIMDEEHLAMSAPIISSYCVVSAVWARIFLKERLSWKHYGMIALVVAGIVILGIFDI